VYYKTLFTATLSLRPDFIFLPHLSETGQYPVQHKDIIGVQAN
jgi:hypothetical protein